MDNESMWAVVLRDEKSKKGVLQEQIMNLKIFVLRPISFGLKCCNAMYYYNSIHTLLHMDTTMQYV